MKILDHDIKIGDISKNHENLKISANVAQDNGFKAEFSLKNLSNTSNFVEEMELGEFDSSESLFMNNFQSWGLCTFVKPEKIFASISNMKSQLGFMATPIPEEFKNGIVSDYFIATDKEFAGFLSSEAVHPYFLWQNGIIKIKVYVGKELKPGEKIELGTLWFSQYESLEETLNEYAKRVADLNQPKTGKPVFGWSSWYHYYLDISQESFIKEMELSKTLNLNYELFQLDDGYEADIGDWLETNEKFSNGLEFLAKKVRENEMIAGIWTAPFSVSESSKLFKEHSDWVVKNENDDPLLAYKNWNKKIYALDTTNPDAQRWLENIFSALKDYGFDFFKIDFLFAAMILGKRYLNVTPVEAYRMGIETIRKAVGESHILGCGAPLLPSVGYVDSMRIGADTAPYWNDADLGKPNAKYSIRNALTRNFMNDVWWTNDPDCVMTRSNDTELNRDERMVNVYTSALLNGHFLESDKLSVLSKDDVCFLKSALNFRSGNSHVKFIDTERYVILSKKTINGDLISFVNLSDSLWNVKIENFSNLLNEKIDGFFVSYPSMKEANPFDSQSVNPHSVLMVLHRGKRKMVREDEKKKDGRDFHYYGSDES